MNVMLVNPAFDKFVVIQDLKDVAKYQSFS
jgi:hypothetical protein